MFVHFSSSVIASNCYAYFVIDKEKKDEDKDGAEKEKEGEKTEENKEGKL